MCRGASTCVTGAGSPNYNPAGRPGSQLLRAFTSVRKRFICARMLKKQTNNNQVICTRHNALHVFG